MMEQHLNDTWSFDDYVAMPEYRDIATRSKFYLGGRGHLLAF